MKPFSICCVGNSHLAALKLAWDSDASKHPGYTIRFYGAPGPNMRRVVISDGKISAGDSELAAMVQQVSGGADTVHVEEFDAFCLVGLELGFRLLSEILLHHLPIAAFEQAHTTQDLISERCLLQCIDDSIEGSLMARIVASLRAQTSKPIVVCSSPHFAEAALKLEDTRHLAPLQKAGLLAPFVSLFDARTEHCLSQLGAAFMVQPADTLVKGCFSADHYRRGATKLLNSAKEHGKDDARHMNQLFGSRLLEELFVTVERLAAGGTQPARC